MQPDDLIVHQLRVWLAEDIGSGDLTTDSFPHFRRPRQRATLQAREPGVLAGLDFALAVFRILDPTLEMETEQLRDGAELAAGTTIGTLCGLTSAILTGERTALNLIQRLSGIATQTRRFVQALAGSRTVLLDTRKTTPGLRQFEKYAVRIGGGHNHRMGLFDGVMLKDNHLAAAGGIPQAIAQVRARVPVTVRVEVETETLDQVRQALAAGADIIMLDNMEPARMREALELIQGQAQVEASGRIRLEDLPALASLGLDYISTSAVVTRAAWLDIGLDFTAG